MRATIQGNSIFLQNPEDGTSALEAADSPDVVNGMTAIIHINDGGFTFLTGFGCLGLCLDSTQTHDMGGCLAKCCNFSWQRTDHVEEV